MQQDQLKRAYEEQIQEKNRQKADALKRKIYEEREEEERLKRDNIMLAERERIVEQQRLAKYHGLNPDMAYPDPHGHSNKNNFQINHINKNKDQKDKDKSKKFKDDNSSSGSSDSESDYSDDSDEEFDTKQIKAAENIRGMKHDLFEQMSKQVRDTLGGELMKIKQQMQVQSAIMREQLLTLQVNKNLESINNSAHYLDLIYSFNFFSSTFPIKKTEKLNMYRDKPYLPIN